MSLGLAPALSFLSPAMLGGWTPSDASAGLLQWLYDLDGDGSPWLLDKANTGTERILADGPGLQTGQSLDLNGTTMSGEISDVAALRPGTGNFAVSAWVKPDAIGSTFWFLGKTNGVSAGTSVGWWFSLATGGTKWSVFMSDGSGSNSAYGPATVSAGQWYHLVGQWNGTNLTLHIDNVKVTGGSVTGIDMDGTDDVEIGKVIGMHAALEMFDLQIFDKALSDDEVEYLYTFGSTGTDPTLTNKQAWLHLDEQSGATGYDCSGNARHATYLGSPAFASHDLHSYQNSNGYRLSAGAFIPRDESDTDNDAGGTALDYSGSAPLHARLRGNPCVTVAGGERGTTYLMRPTTTGEMQIKFKYTGSDGMLMGCNNASAHRCYMGVNGGKLSAGIGSDSWATHQGATSLSSGQWYDGKVTWDGVNVKIYLKTLLTGTEVAWVEDYSGAEAGSIPTSTDFYLGANNNAGTASNHYTGDICDARLNATHRYVLSEGTTTYYNVITYETGGSWAGSPTFSTQDVFAYHATNGVRISGGNSIPALTDGSAAADNNALTNPAVAGHNGAESEIDFDPYNIPRFQNLGFSVYHDYDIVSDDLNKVDRWFVRRVTQGSEETDFMLYDGDLSGDDWDGMHAYIGTVDQLNARVVAYWAMETLTGSMPQTTPDEIGGMTLSGGSMDGESTTSAKNGNGLYLEDTDGSSDTALSGTSLASMNLNAAVSHIGWFKVVAVPDGGDLMILDQNASDQRVEILETGGGLKWTYNGTVINGPTVTDGGWYFYTLARDVDGNLTMWVNGVYQAVTKGATMGSGTGTLAFFEEDGIGPSDPANNPIVTLDEHAAFATDKLRDNHHGFLWNGSSGKFLNTTSNEFEA